MVEGKGKSRKEYLEYLNTLEGLPLIEAVSKSLYKRFYGYGLKKLGIDSLTEIESIVYIFSRETKDKPTFLSLFRDFIDYYRKSILSLSGGSEALIETLSDDYSASEILKRDLVEYLKSLDFNISLFERVFFLGENPKEVFEDLGIDKYFGYREIRRVKAKIYGFLSEY